MLIPLAHIVRFVPPNALPHTHVRPRRTVQVYGKYGLLGALGVMLALSVARAKASMLPFGAREKSS